MGRGDVEGAEVVPVGLDLGTLGDLEPHADEHVLEGVPGPGDEVEVAAGRRPPGGVRQVLGQVEPGGRHLAGQLVVADLLPPPLEQLLDDGAGLVQDPAELPAGLRIERPESAGCLGQGRSLPRHGGRHLADLLGRGRSGDGGPGLVDQGGDVERLFAHPGPRPRLCASAGAWSMPGMVEPGRWHPAERPASGRHVVGAAPRSRGRPPTRSR